MQHNVKSMFDPKFILITYTTRFKNEALTFCLLSLWLRSVLFNLLGSHKFIMDKANF